MFPNLSIPEIIIAGSACCYVVGFVVSNMYLGMFGVLNLDALRSKYLTTGILALGFAGSILYPIAGVIAVFRRRGQETVGTTVAGIIASTIGRYSVVATAVVLLGAATSRVWPPEQYTSLASGRSLGQWAASSSWPALVVTVRTILALAEVGLVLFALLFVLVVALNPKGLDGVRPGRCNLAKDIGRRLLKGLFSGRVLVYVGAVVVLGQVLSLLSFFAGQVPLSFNLNAAWSTFLAAAFLVYAFVTAYFTMLLVVPPPKELALSPAPGAGVGVILLLVALMLPVYTFGVYPQLPQQVGGGMLVPIRVTFDSEVMAIPDIQAETDVYLLDRTGSALILLLGGSAVTRPIVYEIDNSHVLAITYIPQPILH